MKITKLIINNFKSYKEIEFNSQINQLNDVNLFVGTNASGKTNLMQVFDFLKLIKNGSIHKAISSFEGLLRLKNFNSDNNIISIEIEFLQNEKDIHLKIDENYNLRIIKNKFSYKINIIEDKKSKSGFQLYEKILFYENRVLEDKKGKKIDSSLHDFASKVISGLENKNGKYNFIINKDKYHSLKIEQKLVEELNLRYKNKSILEFPGAFLPSNIFDFGIYAIEPKIAKLPNPDAIPYSLDKNGENLVQVINQILKNDDKEIGKQFIADVAGILDFVEDIKIQAIGGRLYLKVKENYNKVYTHGEQLSDGTISIIALIVALYYQEHDIIFIEEPEHDIHPKLIDYLVDKLYSVAKNKKKQIFITTHSPVLLKNVYYKSGLNDIFTIQRNRKMNNTSMIKKPNLDTFKDFLEEFNEDELKEFIKEIGIDNLFIQNSIT